MLEERKQLFRLPFIAPTFDGFIQLEWHDKHRLLEFEGSDTGWSVTGAESIPGSSRKYYSAECGRTDLPKLQTFYDWFVGTELIWPSP
jgi:hypothetical protein